MKKINFKNLNETVYYEKLANGLDVYLYKKEDVNNIFATFTTKYGSLDSEFIPFNSSKFVSVPEGIAHFLEHKIFETDNEISAFDFFNKSGTDVNAYTSYKSTSYLFIGPDNFKENLNYLLDMVQKPYLTYENVEKEKGIIEQELKLYQDEPHFVLREEIMKSVFKVYPAKIPIGGTIESVNQITKDDLEVCYSTFYHPSNMFLIVTGNINIEETMDLIKNNQSQKQFLKTKKNIRKEYQEPKEVVTEYKSLNMNVEIPLNSYNFKIPIKNFDYPAFEIDAYFSILFNILFGENSKLYELLTDKKYIERSLSYFIFNTKDYYVISALFESYQAEEVRKLIDCSLRNIIITQAEFESKQRKMLSSYVRNFDNILGVENIINKDLIEYGKVLNDYDRQIRNLSIETLDEIVKQLDFNNKTTIVINPNK